MRRAASVILGLWLLNILLLTACGQSQLGLDATAVEAVRDARTAHTPTKMPTAIPTLMPTKTPTAMPGPVLLASGQARPDSLVVDSEAVYWTNCGTDRGASTDGAIMAYSKSQGISRPLVSGLSCPSVLQADADSLFWRNHRWTPPESSIFQLSKSGGQPVELASFADVIGNLAVDDTYVYWQGANGVVMRLPKAGGDTPQAAPVPALVFDGPDAYWLNSEGDLIRSSKDGSSAVTLVKKTDLDEYYASARIPEIRMGPIFPKLSEVYIVVHVNYNPGFGSCTDNGTHLLKIPNIGGEFRQVTWVAGDAAVFVTEPFVFFSGYCTHGILKVTLDTQTVETVVKWPEEASDLADDAVYVYWVDSTNGLIKKVVK